jgi:AcrR family transcriptional regulator
MDADLMPQVLDYLADRSLSELTFEDLAAGIGVSQSVLVERFKTKSDLVREIVDTINSRQRAAEEDIAVPDNDLDAYFAGVMAAFEWSLDPANGKLQRLEIEASALDPVGGQAAYTRWLVAAQSDLVALGLSEADAAIEARILNNLFYGFQYDLLINRDRAAAASAFATAMERYRERLGLLIELAG